MLLEDEQQGGPDTGWALSPKSQQSAAQVWVAEARVLLHFPSAPMAQNPVFIMNGIQRSGCNTGRNHQVKGLRTGALSTCIGSELQLPDGVVSGELQIALKLWEDVRQRLTWS